MDAVRKGDTAKLGMLFERHHRAVFDFLVRMTGNAVIAEDLVQDVFVRVLKYRGTWRAEGRFETWLFHIARNARADYFKNRVADASMEEADERPSAAPLPGELLARDRAVARLQRALMLLREDKRELIVLARRDVLFSSNSQDGRELLRRKPQSETPPGMRRLTQPAGFGVDERDNEMSVSAGINREVNLEIEIPVKTRLEVSVVNGGGITVEGVDSEMELNTVDGGITLTNVGGSTSPTPSTGASWRASRVSRRRRRWRLRR
jgi:RNA polymerase sigma-70 factor (ECF subfamily)